MTHNRFSRSMAMEIFTFAWPSMLQVLSNTVVQYADMTMVGTLGTQATAAIGATADLNWLLNSSIAALAVGFVPALAKACGAGDTSRGSHIAEQAVRATLLYGTFLSCLMVAVSPFIVGWMQADPSLHPTATQYFLLFYGPMLFKAATISFNQILWSLGDTRSPMRSVLSVNLLNVTANFLLIFPARTVGGIYIPGAGLGVVGAGLASCFAFCAESCFLFLAVRRNHSIRIRFRKITPDKEVLSTGIGIAIPNMLQRLAISLGAVFVAAMINSLGAVATAANTIANTVKTVFGCGFCTVTAAMTGRMAGKQDEKQQSVFFRTLLRMEGSLIALMSILLCLFAPQIVSVFSRDPVVLALGIPVLRITAFSEFLVRMSQIMENIMLGKGNTKTPFLYNTLTIWLFRIPGIYLCIEIMDFGLIAVSICTAVQAITLLYLFGRHFFKV